VQVGKEIESDHGVLEGQLEVQAKVQVVEQSLQWVQVLRVIKLTRC